MNSTAVQTLAVPKRITTIGERKSSVFQQAVSTGIIVVLTFNGLSEALKKRELLVAKSITPFSSLSKETADVRVDIRTAGHRINDIREVLDPPMAELADFFDVTRQSLHKWTKGLCDPEKSKLPRIHALSAVASHFQEEGISRGWNMLTLKAFNGSSLLDHLKAGSNTPDQVSILVAEAKKMKADYESASKSISKAIPNDEWKSSISIPGGFESA